MKHHAVRMFVLVVVNLYTSIKITFFLCIMTLGLLLASISVSYKVPQILNLYHSGDTSNINPFMALFQCTYSYLYFLYVLHLDNMPLLCLASISLLQSVAIVSLYEYYSQQIAAFINLRRRVHRS